MIISAKTTRSLVNKVNLGIIFGIGILKIMMVLILITEGFWALILVAVIATIAEIWLMILITKMHDKWKADEKR